jgi:hypothetical protein
VELGEILETPAGRWLAVELGLGEGALERATDPRVQFLRERFENLRERYHDAAPADEDAFTRGSAAELGHGSRQLLDGMLGDELAGRAHFVDEAPRGYARTREIFLQSMQATDAGTTVQVSGTVRGRYGKTCYILKRLAGKPWISTSLWREIPQTLQGDPRWLIAAGGEDFASFLGFKLVADDTMIVPGPEELQAAIEKLNVALVQLGAEPIPVRFRRANGEVGPYRYGMAFSRGEVPMALDGHMLLHDVSFHAGSLLVTGAMLGPAQAEGHFLDAFQKFVAARSPGLLAQASTREAFDRAWESVATRFDSGAGNYASTASALAGFGDGGSAQQMIAWMTTEVRLQLSLKLLRGDFATPADGVAGAMGLAQQAGALADLRALLDEFSRGEGAGLNAKLPEAREELNAVEQLRQRVAQLQQAAQQAR